MSNITTTEGQALAAPRGMGFDLSPQTFEQAVKFSHMLADSDLVPKDFRGKPGNCLIAIQWGAEIGLKPLQALQNIAPINGRPSLWGDAMLALVRSSPLCESVVEGWYENGTAYCRVKRRGEVEQERTFSDEDAQLAGLLNKAGPWTTSKKRMKQMRARAFALRDVFTDVLRGMPMAEEVRDLEHTEKHMGHAEVVQPVTYPQADFEKNLPAWSKVISSGRKTLADLAAMVGSKAPLTDAQKQALQEAVDKLQAGTVDNAAPAQGPAPVQPATEPEPEAAPTAAGPVVTFAQVNTRLSAAKDLDALYDAASLIGEVADPQHRAELTEIFDKLLWALEQS